VTSKYLFSARDYERPDVSTLYQLNWCDNCEGADVFVLPSTGIGEAWPVSVMEAMSAGLPVIASIIGATPEMIADRRDGFLVPQGAEDALFKLLDLFHSDRDMRRKVGTEARLTAIQWFDVELTAKTLLDAIDPSRND
jgi:glycosyltransferase involved in cell wall biosynthesis